MRIARTTSKETLSYEEIPPPESEAGQVLVRIHYVSLCGTDLHIWEDDFPTELPIVQGHEMSGIVEAIGSGVSAFEVGDRVAVNPVTSCGSCGPCSSGRFNVCASLSVLGCYEDGGFAELLSVPAGKLSRVPDELSLDLAAMGEPASVAMQAVNRGRPEPGEVAVVLGSGPIGLLAMLYLTDLGVTVIAADTDPDRLSLAITCGAAETLRVDASAPFPSPDQTAVIENLTGAAGPTLVIEATGVPTSFENAIRLVAPAGRVVQVGISPRSAALSMKEITFKELDILGSRNSLGLIPEGLELLSRHPEQARTLMTHHFAFGDLGDAYRLMRSHTEIIGKIVIEMPIVAPARP